MQCDILKDCFLGIISRQARKRLVKQFTQKSRCNILVMTLLVKDEEDIIEKNIRFHHAMGVDGFIVTSHDSHDSTNSILDQLKKEGLVLEIIKVSGHKYKQTMWVNNMILLAKRKYHADWVINADADEFYYSNDLNLKHSINKYSHVVNDLWVDSLFFIPNECDDYLNGTRFVLKPLKEYEAYQLSLDVEWYKEYIGSQGCTKVIHSVKGYKWIEPGNHRVEMKKNHRIFCGDIRLYHYHIRSFKDWEAKIRRYIDVVEQMPKGQGNHMKLMVKLYKDGCLWSEYKERYLSGKIDVLYENGVVGIDPSVRNFMKKIGIL